MNIKWLNSSNHTLHSYTGLDDYTEHTLNYTISNVKLSDAGQYTCSVFIDASMNNNVILDSGTKSNSTNITIKRKLQCKVKHLLLYFVIVPNGTVPSITVDQNNPLFGVGSNAYLSCSVYYANSSFIDVDTTVHIEWKHNDLSLQSLSTINTYSTISLHYLLNDVINGEYICESYLSATDVNPFIKDSNTTSNTTVITG